MAVSKVHVGDIGTKLRLDAGESIAAATLLRIYYKKPSGDTGYWTATLEGTDYATYTTVDNSDDDLDEDGNWELQLYIESPDWTGFGEAARFHVYKRVFD